MSELLAVVTGFFAATLRISTPLLLAATGELINERAGIINLGIEGGMLAGALASAIGAAAGGPWVGVLLGAGAGMLVAGIFSAVAIGAKADQIIAGTAITLGLVGATGAIYRTAFGPGGPGLAIPTFASLSVPGLSDLPVIGPAIFQQSALTYFAWCLIPLTAWFLFRSWWGLALRASGESAAAALAAGVPVRRVRICATVGGGALTGLAGASLVLAQVGTFAEKMTAGRGFIAIAIVVLGGWRPGGVLLAALLFGAASALQFAFQAMDLRLPYQLFLVMPYALALLALAKAGGRASAPAELGK